MLLLSWAFLIALKRVASESHTFSLRSVTGLVS